MTTYQDIFKKGYTAIKPKTGEYATVKAPQGAEFYKPITSKKGYTTKAPTTGNYSTLKSGGVEYYKPITSKQGYSNVVVNKGAKNTAMGGVIGQANTDAMENARLKSEQPPTTPTTPTTTPTTPTTSTEANFTPNYDFSNYSTSLTNYLNSIKAPTPEQEIEKQNLYAKLLKERYDPKVAAITAVYNDILARQQEQSKGAIGQTRAMANAAGLAGTPMGQAQMQKTAERQAQIEKAIDLEKGAKIGVILGEAEQAAVKMAEANTLKQMNYADKALKVQNEAITQMKKNLFDLAKAGYGWDAQTKQLAEQAGYTGDLAEVLYKANQPTGVDWEKVTLKDGSVMLYGQNKGTGQFEKKIIRPDQPEGYEWTLINGQEYYVPEGNKDGDLTGAIKKVSEEDKEFAQWKRKEDYEEDKEFAQWKRKEDYSAMLKNISGGSGEDMNELLTPTEATKLGVPYGTTKGEAAKMMKEPESEKNIKNITSQVDELMNKWNNISSIHKGQIQGRFQQITGGKERNEALQSFETQKNLMGMQIARLYEKGRMSDQDRIFYLSLIPNINQDKKSAQASANELKRLLEAQLKTGASPTTGNNNLDEEFDSFMKQ